MHSQHLTQAYRNLGEQRVNEGQLSFQVTLARCERLFREWRASVRTVREGTIQYQPKDKKVATRIEIQELTG